MAGSANVPASPEAKPQTEGAGAGAESEREGDYIEFDFDTLLAPGEIPAVLREEPAGDRAAADRAAPPGGGAAGESHLYGIGEELVRLRRQIDLRREEAKVLAQLQGEADSPATRDLIEAAFAAGYFAGKGELERRIGHLR
ncbi:MAG: hypothetical protein ACREKI_07765 [Gemmatimonadota bacterium]